MRFFNRNKADIFEITEENDEVQAVSEETTDLDAEVSFQLELLKELQNLREEMNQLVQMQLELMPMIRGVQARDE